jgi:hypothetical protein
VISQETFEYKELVKGEKVTNVDIKIQVFQDKITILSAMPNTNYVEVLRDYEYKIIKYVGEMPIDDKGYKSKVYELENEIFITLNYKSTKDHWCMMTRIDSEDYLIYQKVR